MRVEPLAFDSLGVRSMATYVEAGDLKMVIDPAVALAPRRFGLPPHPVEEEARRELWGRVKERAAEAGAIVVTHYHYDHVEPGELEIYRGKVVYVKHPRRMINPSQMGRAAELLPGLRRVAAEVIFADGRSFGLGGAEVRFSRPVPHGGTASRGYVLEVSVRADEVFLHTSDVQGPLLREQVEFVLDEGPDLLIVDGPTTYIESPYAELELREANENLVEMVRRGGVRRLVVDHHLARDLLFRERIEPVYRAGEEHGVAVMCAAEFLCAEPNLLEARRRELYGEMEGERRNG